MRPYAELRRQFVDVTITHCVRRRWSSCGWEGNRGPVPLCVGGAAAAGGARSRSVRGPHGVRALAGVRPERRRDDTDPAARHCALLARPRPPQRPRAHRRPAGEVHTDTPRYYACSNRPHCRSAGEVRVFTCSRTRTAMYFFGVAWILRPIKGVNFLPPPKKKLVGASIGLFKPNVQNILLSYYRNCYIDWNQIIHTTIETIKYFSRAVQICFQQIQHGGRPPYWNSPKIAISLFDQF